MDTWFENESFWREGYRFMFSDDAFRVATDQVEQVIALTGISVGRVLDLGCGPGRHAVPLALKGFHVTAVDASPFLLGKAQEYANRSNVDVDFVHADMRGRFVVPTRSTSPSACIAPLATSRTGLMIDRWPLTFTTVFAPEVWR